MRLSSKICKACLTCTQNIFSWPPTLRASAPLLLESMRKWILPCLINKRRRGFGWGDSYLSENTAQKSLPDRRSCRFWRMEFSRGGKGKSKDNDIVHSLSLQSVRSVFDLPSFGPPVVRSVWLSIGQRAAKSAGNFDDPITSLGGSDKNGRTCTFLNYILCHNRGKNCLRGK